MVSWVAAFGGQVSADGGAIRVGMTGGPVDDPDAQPVGLRFVAARYEVDVLGPLAFGTLVQEFRNDAPQDVLANYRVQGSGGLEMESLEIRVGGVIQEEPSTEDGSEQAADDARTKARSDAKNRGATRREKILVESGQQVSIRSTFQTSVSLTKGQFRLLLPAVEAERDPIPDRKKARRRFVSLDELLDVHGPSRESAAAPSLSIQVSIEHDQPLLRVHSTSHEIDHGYYGDRTLVELAKEDDPSRAAFQLSFALGSQDEATFLVFAGPVSDGARNVMAVLSPPTDPQTQSVRPKQVLFVLDTSGSMRAGKLNRAREALSACLEMLGPDDLFNIVEFDSDHTMLAPEPVNQDSLAPGEAERWLEELAAKGGTKLLPALSATFEQAESPDHHRMIIVLTDGAVDNEDEVLELVGRDLGAGRLFVVGIGKDVRKETIHQLAEEGRGTAAFAGEAGSIEPVVGRLFGSVAAPVAWDLEIDWGGAQVEAVEPERLADLYAGRTVTAVARVRGELPEEIAISGLDIDGDRTWVGAVRSLDETVPSRFPSLREPADSKTKRPGSRKQKR
jgi:Ca-activated chloride channel family protein